MALIVIFFFLVPIPEVRRFELIAVSVIQDVIQTLMASASVLPIPRATFRTPIAKVTFHKTPPEKESIVGTPEI